MSTLPGLAAACEAAAGESLVHEAPSSLPEEVQSAYDHIPATVTGTLSGVVIIAVLFWGLTPAWVLLPWLVAFAGVVALRSWNAAQFKRAQPRTLAEFRHWRLRSSAGSLVSGALWGVGAWVLYPWGHNIQQIGLIVMVYTFCVAAMPVLATQPRIYLAYTSVSFVPMAARIASDGTRYSYQLAAVLLVIITFTTGLARSYRFALQRVIELKLHADELLAQLRIEKQAADVARREAEVANRAKTQFFTAASHDLRQPLHAMGLFAEALRQRSHDEEVTQLVNSINGSVDALEELFSELLNISRIDSGGVDVRPQYFEVGDLFRKLRLHFEPIAFEKGLALRLRGDRHIVHADPVLVERVLRNLVSNAIRYTEDGSVLVSCRRRNEHVLLQVWDTGIGIAQQHLAQVFEEFYQVPQRDAAASQQRKGLGLGLSIVKRLADLMQAPLSMCSEPGRGTVFTLQLQLGKVARPAPLEVPGKPPLALTLSGRLIVIVEDEPAVRSGLEVLIKGWGAGLASFDSVAACSAWAQATDPARVKPDLLIVDYRLESGLNGVDALNALRQRFGADTPAIMVTGSTMTGHEKEAQQHDFHLLIKPVVPNKLRAMIAFKLGVKPAANTA